MNILTTRSGAGLALPRTILSIPSGSPGGRTSSLRFVPNFDLIIPTTRTPTINGTRSTVSSPFIYRRDLTTFERTLATAHRGGAVFISCDKMNAADALQAGAFVLVVALLVKPVGAYLERVFERRQHFS